MNCLFCGARLVVTNSGTWREVVGWVQQRKQGGAHGVHAQSETGRYACESCMALKRRGIAIQQGALW